MNNAIVRALLGVLLAGGVCLAADEPPLSDVADKVSYSVGYQIGEDLKRQGMDFDSEAFLKGAEDAASEAKPRYSPGEMRSILLDLKKQFSVKETARKEADKTSIRKTREKQTAEDKDFLVSNGKRSGVVSMPDGLQYEILRKGTGDKPGPGDVVSLNYRATLTDGTEFDSSYRSGKPKSFRVGSMISGLREVLPLMQEGARWKVFIPASLGYTNGPLEDRAVVFDIELLTVGTPK